MRSSQTMSCSCWILATMQASHKLGSQKCACERMKDTPLKRKWTFNRAADIRGGRKMKGRRDTGITFSFSAFVRGV
ncbi:hypothetical protein VYU27_008242 [Nannochloropsis oceanica]